jgi:hypothetical protein
MEDAMLELRMTDLTAETGDGAQGAAMYHGMAMAKEPQMAMAGRCLKEIYNTVERWIDAECNRGPFTNETLLLATPTILVNLASMLVGHATKTQSEEGFAAVLDLMGRAVGTSMSACAVEIVSRAKR